MTTTTMVQDNAIGNTNLQNADDVKDKSDISTNNNLKEGRNVSIVQLNAMVLIHLLKAYMAGIGGSNETEVKDSYSNIDFTNNSNSYDESQKPLLSATPNNILKYKKELYDIIYYQYLMEKKQLLVHKNVNVNDDEMDSNLNIWKEHIITAC